MSVLEEPMEVLPLEHRFGLHRGFTLGVEDELLLVDGEGGELVAEAERLIATVAPRHGRLSSEIFAAEVELVTPVCRGIAQVHRSLTSMLEDVHRAGMAVIGAGLHSTATLSDARLSTSPRYAAVSESLQGLLRTPPAGLHVHIGMPDCETALCVANRLRRHLPLLHSLAANSPFWYGRDSGLASARAAVLRSYPRYGVPPWFRDWEQFSAVARDLADAAGVPDYTYFWWEVRPHPRLGTVEVRAADAQFSLERTIALSALIHALARREAEQPPALQRSRDAIEESCYQATRYGLDALLHDDAGERVGARELAGKTLRLVMPYARELGCADALEGIERILLEGNGADVQRRVHRERGMSGLLAWLVAQRTTSARGDELTSPPEAAA